MCAVELSYVPSKEAVHPVKEGKYFNDHLINIYLFYTHSVWPYSSKQFLEQPVSHAAPDSPMGDITF